MKKEVQDFIQKNYPDFKQQSLKQLSGGGGGRTYFEFHHQNQKYIATHNANLAENQSFFKLTKLLIQLNNPVPEIYHISPKHTTYIQTHLGNTSLLDLQIQDPQQALPFYKKAVKQLAQLQISTHQVVDYASVCYDDDKFNTMLVLRDLFYFKHYFLDLIGLTYSQKQLLTEFNQIAQNIEQIPEQFFMYRDFQGRNIMVQNNQIYLIDYQGGMMGPLQYDLASLLWQAKANLSADTKNQLYQDYLTFAKQLLPKLDPNSFNKGYNLCLIARLLQVLGAYGFLGLYHKKPHFTNSIQLGIQNLVTISKQSLLQDFPAIENLVNQMNTPKIQSTIQKIIQA